MNSVALVGRLTKDPDIRYTNEGTSIASFSLAVDRKFSKKHEADFINCKAFGKTAEFIEKYFKKGQRLGLNGRIQTGSYINRDENKVYTTEVICESCEFVEGKAADSPDSKNETPNKAGDNFMDIPESLEDELPFI